MYVKRQNKWKGEMAFVGPSVLRRRGLSLVLILKEEKTEICGPEHYAELHTNEIERTDPRLRVLYFQCIFHVISLFK